MPNIFKALASITAWVLFIIGLITVVMTFIMANITQMQGGYAGPPPVAASINLVIGIACIVLSVVVMWIRQKMQQS
jgi:hypothetical protein